MREALAGKTASFVGPLGAVREFIYVPDIADPLLRLAALGDAYGRCWNLGGQSIEARAFADAVFVAVGLPPKYRSIPRFALQLIGLASRSCARSGRCTTSSIAVSHSTIRRCDNGSAAGRKPPFRRASQRRCSGCTRIHQRDLYLRPRDGGRDRTRRADSRRRRRGRRRRTQHSQEPGACARLGGTHGALGAGSCGRDLPSGAASSADFARLSPTAPTSRCVIAPFAATPTTCRHLPFTMRSPAFCKKRQSVRRSCARRRFGGAATAASSPTRSSWCTVKRFST